MSRQLAEAQRGVLLALAIILVLRSYERSCILDSTVGIACFWKFFKLCDGNGSAQNLAARANLLLTRLVVWSSRFGRPCRKRIAR